MSIRHEDVEAGSPPPSPTYGPRPDLGVTLGRAARLRCPKCGQGREFQSWIRMAQRCESCGLRFERAPGYFLGSAYINYGLTAMCITFAYFTLHFGLGWTNRQLAPGLVTFCIVFPLFFFRFALAFWLGVDFWLDPVGFQDDRAD